MITNTMLVGHVVTAEVVKTDADGTMHCIFIHHTTSGSKNLCLDFGQNWNVSEGYEFTCTQVQVDRAAYWMKGETTNFNVTAANVAKLATKV